MLLQHPSANRWTLMSGLASLLILCSSAWASQPNIVLIIADDLGYGELSCQGNTEFSTPAIDALAASGVRCTRAYVTAPNCSPSRAGIMSGLTPTRFGYEFNPIGARNDDPGTGFPSHITTIAECLQEAGYTTGLVGKWHLGGAADYHPLRHGFNEFYGFMHEGHYYKPSPWVELTSLIRKRGLPPSSGPRVNANEDILYTSHMGHNEPAYDANNPILRGGQPVDEQDYLTDAFAQEAVEFIERYQNTPFFLCLSFNAVHSPLQAKKSTLLKLQSVEDIHRRIFAAMVTDLDLGVGRVTRQLDELGLRRNTLIIFLSDNGGPTKELTSSNYPLRGGKGTMYEGGLRVPFIASWPSSIPAATICDQTVSSLDIYPTLAKIANATAADKLDGFDALPLWQGNQLESNHQRLYWRQGNRAALLRGNMKVVTQQQNDSERVWELYNLETDLTESNDLANAEPELLQELTAEWKTLDQEMSAPLFNR